MTLAFALAGSLLLVLLAGYPLWLRAGRAAAVPGAAPAVGFWPAVTIVVPTHDEADFIADKLADVHRQDYPGRWELVVADGASTDATVAIARAACAASGRGRVVEVGVADKTRQLNAILPMCEGEWVFVTDADTRLPPDALRAMIDCVRGPGGRLAAGTAIEPVGGHGLERAHWRTLNELRRAEFARGSAAIVTGTGYVFRRDLIDAFPADVVADDVHVAFRAMAAGGSVGFVPITGVELRAPTTFRELLWHKQRKGRAFMREVLRFLPAATRMRPACRTVFLWRALHILLAPLLLLLTLATGLASCWLHPGEALPMLGVAAGLGVLAAAPWRKNGLAAVQALLLGGVVLLVLGVCVLTYPWTWQSANFRRIVVRGGTRGMVGNGSPGIELTSATAHE